MLQAHLIAPGAVEVREVPTPLPKEGEILVRVEAALTCGTDLKAFRRGHPLIPMPGPFGHEYSGTVAARGRGVRKFKEGDAVMGVHSAPCLGCRFCEKKLYNLCERLPHTMALGSFAEYVLLPSHVTSQNVFKKPVGLKFTEAALLEPLACVVHGTRPLRIRPGDTALVIGGGPIGLLHVLVLRHRGARVSLLDPHPGRLRAARRMGAEPALPPAKVRSAVKRATSGMGFDFVFECTGRPEVWESAIDHPRPGGTLTLFGGCPKGTRVTYDTYRIHYGEITLRGVFHYTPADVRMAYGLLAGGALKVGGMISGSFKLQDVGKALALLSEGRGVKYAVIP